MKKTIIVLLAIVMISSLMAQPRTNRSPRNHRPMGVVGMKHNFAQPSPQGFGQPSERMEMLMVWKLTEDLKLTPEQADKFFPRMRAHRENTAAIDKDIRETVKDIRQKVMRGDNISNKEFDEVFGKVTTLEMEKIDEKVRFMDEMEGILNNAQRVKLAIFKERFTKEIQERIKNQRR